MSLEILKIIIKKQDDDWEDVEQPSPFTPSENYVISDFLDREQELEDIENDPDIKNDEIYNLKLSVSV